MTTDRSKPVDDPSFWKERLDQAKLTGDIRHSVFRAPENEWQKVCQDHVNILNRLILSDWTILDAGCGYGRGVELMPPTYRGRYVGVDQSQDFITIAEMKYPNEEFYCENLTSLPFDDDEFDLSICTSVMIMVVQNLGWFEWEKIQNELLRVSKRGILCLEYGVTDTNTASSTYYRIEK